jgi:hypothetical protein
VRTGRASATAPLADSSGDGGGSTYWVSDDGTRVLRGDVAESADELQRGFLDAMVRAGSV